MRCLKGLRGFLCYAEGENGESAVHHGERHYAEIAYLKRLVGTHYVEIYGRNARVFVLHKTIGHVVADIASRGLVGIYLYITEMAVRAQVVHASHMVVVVVGDEYAVNLSERLGENLFTEVGTAVDEQACGMRFYERRTAKTLVVRVGAAANFALAAYYWYTTTGASAEECKFHVAI